MSRELLSSLRPPLRPTKPSQTNALEGLGLRASGLGGLGGLGRVAQPARTGRGSSCGAEKHLPRPGHDPETWLVFIVGVAGWTVPLLPPLKGLGIRV